MNQQIDAEKLINILVGKIAQLELENAKLKALIDTEDEEQKGISEWAARFTISNWNNRKDDTIWQLRHWARMLGLWWQLFY